MNGLEQVKEAIAAALERAGLRAVTAYGPEKLAKYDGPVVAVLRESFAGAPGPYLSMAVGELHLLDARYYDGSVREKLAEIRPDVVVSLLNVECYVHAYFNEVH